MRLLIVDDEHYIVNYLAALVEAHAPEDLEVYKCYSGMEALELSKTMKREYPKVCVNLQTDVR